MVNSNWYRRMSLNQVGMFAAPKILYMTQTETEGAPQLLCCSLEAAAAC